MKIESVFSEGYSRFGRVWDDIPPKLVRSVTRTLEEATPVPAGTDYVASEPALEMMPATEQLKLLMYGGRPVQLGWCNGHNTKLNCLEYHRSSEFNVGTRDFLLLLAGLDQVVEGSLDTSLVRIFRVPANIVVEVFATTLHYAPCQIGDAGFRVMIALPQGTNCPKPKTDSTIDAGDAGMLWAQDKWLLAHSESAEAAQGAHVGLEGENLDMARAFYQGRK